MTKRKAAVAVTIDGSSWGGIEKGFYNFEATVDGKPSLLRVSEEVAFDFLGAWTRSRTLCLEILRLHRGDLAETLARKLRLGARTAEIGLYSLTLRDMERIPATHRKRPRVDPSRPSPQAPIAARSQSVL